MKQFATKSIFALMLTTGALVGLTSALICAPQNHTDDSKAGQRLEPVALFQPQPAIAAGARPANPHARGLKLPPPDVLKRLHRESFERHKERLHIHKRVAATAPAIWDSRTKGVIPPIQDQGQCGSCWDFSGTDVVMFAYWAVGQKVLLSQQYTLDCYRNGGCDGDDNTTVLDHAKSTGLPTQQDYGPYQASAGRCKSGSMTMHKVTDWLFLDSNGGQGVTSVADIKAGIMLYGGAGVAGAAGNDWDSAGDNSTITGRSRDINHDISLVGWDDNHDNGDGSKGAWIMRNNWSTQWGGHCANSLNPSPTEAGYAWIKYGADSIGTEAVAAYLTAPTPPLPPSGGAATAVVTVALPAGPTMVTNSAGVTVGTLVVTAPTQPGTYSGSVTPVGAGSGTITFTTALPSGTTLTFSGLGTLSLAAPVAAGDVLTLTSTKP